MDVLLQVAGELVGLQVQVVVVVPGQVHDRAAGGHGVQVDELLFCLRVEYFGHNYFFRRCVHLPRDAVTEPTS